MNMRDRERRGNLVAAEYVYSVVRRAPKNVRKSHITLRLDALTPPLYTSARLKPRTNDDWRRLGPAAV